MIILRFLLKGKSERVEGRSHYTPDGRSHSVFPPIPSQGKNLNMGAGDRPALPKGARKVIVTRRLSVGGTGLKAKVGLKPTSFVVGNRRLG
ncbi:hypothetical protein [Cylindrospermopsis raciborskii]|uniref:hypothetical protein n=1 Tax=Cylindrospermopsis raciborskii TaxID=77022 RepID=UPI001181362B|nr:hypothetical protein [Cylindrospermopsis raciborskii]